MEADNAVFPISRVRTVSYGKLPQYGIQYNTASTRVWTWAIGQTGIKIL